MKKGISVFSNDKAIEIHKDFQTNKLMLIFYDEESLFPDENDISQSEFKRLIKKLSEELNEFNK